MSKKIITVKATINLSELKESMLDEIKKLDKKLKFLTTRAKNFKEENDKTNKENRKLHQKSLSLDSIIYEKEKQIREIDNLPEKFEHLKKWYNFVKYKNAEMLAALVKKESGVETYYKIYTNDGELKTDKVFTSYLHAYRAHDQDSDWIRPNE